MKTFHCVCGQRVFFENTRCNQCQRSLGFDPERLDMLSFDVGEGSAWRMASGQLSPDQFASDQVDSAHSASVQSGNGSSSAYKPCGNYINHDVCNWVLPAESPDKYCLACRLNQIIPAITAPDKRLWWAQMELAKRRLLTTLLRLKLKTVPKRDDPDGLGFAFLEDQRMNPRVREQFVATGHAQGLITVNLAEADPAQREKIRMQMGESYRTLLGHFRHESGHYYFDQLITSPERLAEFRALFGDEREDYDAALKRYYDNPTVPTQQTGHVSSYAQSHPLEDWAECWAHYLHMVDTLETAAEFGLVEDHFGNGDIDRCLRDWSEVTVALNSLNRSMGLQDACPFVYSEQTMDKVRFIHRSVWS